MPFFSCVAMSASIVLPRRHSSMKACNAGFFAPAASAIGCSAAIAMNVTPNKVSARVVNTFSAPSAPISAFVSGAYGNAISQPSDLPIQLACMVFTRSGQSGSFSRSPNNSSAYFVMREVVHRDLALLDERAGAPAAAVDDLLVGEHGLVDRIPVHDAGLAVRDALLEHAQEQPLVPAVVRRIAGGDLARPVEGEAQRLQLALHVGDVVARPLGRRHAVLDGRVLGRQAEGIPAHGLQHDLALHHARSA